MTRESTLTCGGWLAINTTAAAHSAVVIEGILGILAILGGGVGMGMFGLGSCSTSPGYMQLQLIPSERPSRAVVSVRPISPDLAAL